MVSSWGSGPGVCQTRTGTVGILFLYRNGKSFMIGFRLMSDEVGVVP